MTAAFATRLVPGEDFVVNEAVLTELENGSSLAVKVDKKLMALEQSVALMRDQMENGFTQVNARLQVALDAQDEQHFKELQDTVKKAVLPLPCSSVKELEEFLSASPVQFDAAIAMFGSDPHILATKANVAALYKAGKCTPSFPAGVILRFIFTLEGIGEISHRDPDCDFGPATTDYIVSRACFLMGKKWKKSGAWIMSRMRKSVLHYKKK